MSNRFEEIEEEVLHEPDEEPFVRERDEERSSEGILSAHEEALLKNPDVVDDIIGQANESLYDYEKHRGEVPERLKPLFLLHQFNNLFEKEVEENTARQTKQFAQEHIKFETFLKDERIAEEDPYLPTVGVEVEVPRKFDIPEASHPFFVATTQLGIPNAYDQSWEFAVPYTYSAKAQSAIVHELIRGGFIETESQGNGEKKIKGEGDFSLHVNIGVPEEIVPLSEHFFELQRFTPSRANRKEVPACVSHNPAMRVPWELRISADVMTNALTYAFTSPERIEKRKTADRNYITEDAAEKTKKKGRTIRPPETEDNHSQRFEIRSLEVRDKTLYRMLAEAQNISAALFSRYRVEWDEASQLLGDVWKEFEEEVWALFEKYDLELDTLDENPEDAINALRETKIQSEFRELVTKTSIRIDGIIRESRVQREKDK